MLGMVSVYNPDEHTILGGELAAWLNQLVEGDPLRRGRLFLVRYNKIGSFVIAEWMGKSKNIYVDVLNLGKSINLSRARAGELRRRLFASHTAEGMVKLTTQADSDYHHAMQDENAEERECQAKEARGE